MNSRLALIIWCSFALMTGIPCSTIAYTSSMDALLDSCPREVESAYLYYLGQVELDPLLTHEKQVEKLEEFKIYEAGLSQATASLVTQVLLEETRLRIIDILQNAALDDVEITEYLADYEKVIQGTLKMDIEFARLMLFFVAELKIHRQYVYEFGITLGCPEKQLLRHDLCKLRIEQFEGYARYFRGGKHESDKAGYLHAWEEHQHEEHHHECYSAEGFSFDSMSDKRLRDNMLEMVADVLAATKQRGGRTLIDWLVRILPNKHPHPRLIPFLEEALIKAHGFYLESESNPQAHSIFRGLPCWNSEVAEIFKKLERATPRS